MKHSPRSQKFLNVSPLIEKILKIKATDYREIQEKIQRNLRGWVIMKKKGS